MSRALVLAASSLLALSSGCTEVLTTSSSTGSTGGSGGSAACVPVDDHDPCTDDRCEGGVPVHTAKPNGVACGSADGCTVGGTCQDGACAGATPIGCTGDAVCVAGACVSPVCTGTLGLPEVPQIPVGKSPSSILAADLNGDGKPDLAVANAGDDTVSVLLDKGNGTYAPALDHAVGAHPSALAASDLNGDGKPDLAVANADAGTVSVLLNQGGGAFAPAADYAAGAAPSSVAIADLNGDGQLDLVVANHGSGDVSVLINQGDGTFAPAVDFGAGAGASAVAAADLNGDGALDLVVADEDGDAVSVLLNQGNGAFAAATDYAVGTGPAAIALADLNGDGKPDLAVGNVKQGSPPFGYSVNVLLNDGDGNFGPPVGYSLLWGFQPVHALAAADMDGDGRPDLVAVSTDYAEGGAVNVLFNQGDGTFGALARYGVGNAPRALSVADLNGDGRPDVAVANVVGDTVTVLLNHGQGAFHAVAKSNSGACHTAVTADLSGDGLPDLAIVNCAAGTFSAVINQGNGTFAPPVETPLYASEPMPVTAADVNGDGLADVAIGDRDNGRVTVLISNGDGTFAPAKEYATDPTSTWPSQNSVLEATAIAAADLNGDGLPDLAVAHQDLKAPKGSRNGVRVLVNLGDGTFELGHDTSVETAPVAMAVADLNGDGKPDLAVTTDSGHLAVLIGDGDGDFAPAVLYEDGGRWAVTAADWNGDGKPDLAALGDNGVIVLINQGDGTFAPGADAPAAPGNVAAADMNGDGQPDLIVLSSSSNTVGVLLNQGNGTFAPPLVYGTRLSASMVLATDMNRDGRPDLAVVNVDSEVSVMINACLP